VTLPTSRSASARRFHEWLNQPRATPPPALTPPAPVSYEVDRARLEALVASDVQRQLPTWLAWYYSPLNLHYWAMALFFMTPALAVHLVARYLAWRWPAIK